MARKSEPKKMIQIVIYLHTDGLAPRGTASPLKKHAWEGGIVRIPANVLHGIGGSEKAKRFRLLLQLPTKIEELLRENGITVHLAASKKYMTMEGRKK
jgi:hypothetical protein